MQGELDAEYPLLKIQLLGINEKGQESGNTNATNGRDIPWLQDVDLDGNGRADVAYDLWDVTFRDVVILDGNNVQVDVYNLNDHNLAEAEEYAALKEMLIDAAMTSQRPWRNPVDANDVDDNQVVAPLDVLLIINVLNDVGPYELPPPAGNDPIEAYYDCNGDGFIAPSDALQVINFLNGLVLSEAEGEASVAIGLSDGLPSVERQPETQSNSSDIPTTAVAQPLQPIETFTAVFAVLVPGGFVFVNGHAWWNSARASGAL